MRARMAASVRSVEGSANRIAVGGGLTNFIADSLAGLAIGFAIYYGSWRVSVHHGEVGSFVSFLGALLLAYEPAKRLSRFPVDIQNGLVGANKIYEVLDSPPGETSQPGAPALRVTEGRVRSKAPASPIARARTRSTASISSPSQARPRPWSARRAAASRRSSASSSASMR